MYITPREQEAIILLTEGMTQKEAAYQMGITRSTVKNLLISARKRNEARTTAHLLAIVVGRELVQMEEEQR